MQVLILGGSGFIGRALVSRLCASEHQVFVYTHRKIKHNLNFPKKVTVITKDSPFPKVDAIVNLAGESIAKYPLTKARLKKIVKSRTDTIDLLVQKYGHNFPKIYLGASATGIYQNSRDPLDESSQTSFDFYANLCHQIEKKTSELFDKYQISVYLVRFSVVVGSGGGICRLLRFLPRLYFLGANNYIPYIKLEDCVKALEFLLNLEHKKKLQVVNICFPNYLKLNSLLALCSNNLPIIVPKLFLKLDKRAHLLQADQKIMPKFLLEKGFKFE